jgi:hypothetical protein
MPVSSDRRRVLDQGAEGWERPFADRLAYFRRYMDGGDGPGRSEGKPW